MFGIGWTEFIVIAFVLLIFVGPRQLPGMLRKVGSIVAELKAASRELRNQVSNEVREIETDLGEASPRHLMGRIKDDIDFEASSPYDVILEEKTGLKREIQSVKTAIDDADPTRTPAATGPDADETAIEDGPDEKGLP